MLHNCEIDYPNGHVVAWPCLDLSSRLRRPASCGPLPEKVSSAASHLYTGDHCGTANNVPLPTRELPDMNPCLGLVSPVIRFSEIFHTSADKSQGFDLNTE
jgi:hypothetical protein